jgi:hypothetical protein
MILGLSKLKSLPIVRAPLSFQEIRNKMDLLISSFV